ncbi:MAG: hypothetical protein WBG16_07580 [Bradyrhizobium sp.]
MQEPQPSAPSDSRCSDVSTPSANVIMSRAAAIFTTACTIEVPP